MTTPLTYCIEVSGVIDENFSAYLGDMKSRRVTEAGDGSKSTLCGTLKDQSALLGVLNTLNNLHFPILSVTLSKYSNDNGE